jgi:hypothetical protein
LLAHLAVVGGLIYVGYRHFEEFFGMREGVVTVRAPDGEAKVVVLDSTKPDLDEGDYLGGHDGPLALHPSNVNSTTSTVKCLTA